MIDILFCTTHMGGKVLSISTCVSDEHFPVLLVGSSKIINYLYSSSETRKVFATLNYASSGCEMNHSSFQVSYLCIFSFVFLVALKNVADDILSIIFLIGNRTRPSILLN